MSLPLYGEIKDLKKQSVHQGGKGSKQHLRSTTTQCQCSFVSMSWFIAGLNAHLTCCDGI